MPALERIPVTIPDSALGAMFRHAYEARTMLEKVWDNQTAYQGIEITPEDALSRGNAAYQLYGSGGTSPHKVWKPTLQKVSWR